MRILCDEGVDREIVERLRAEGHDVIYIAEVASGASDEEVFDRANRDEAVLVTTDKDFGELVFRQERITGGVVLVRLAGLSQRSKAHAVAAVVRDYAGDLPGGFAVIEPGRVRIRGTG